MSLNFATPFALFFVTFFGCLFVLYSISREDAEGGDLELQFRRKVNERRVLKGQELHLPQVGPNGLKQSVDREEGHSEGPEQDEYAKMLRLGIVRPEILSWSPRVMILENFLSARECDHIVSLARGGLEPSTVVDLETGQSVPDVWRNSSGYFLSEEQEKDEIVAPILERISVYTQVPVQNGEPMQVLQYKNGQFYMPHEDYIYGPASAGNGGRLLTVLLYLTDGVVGGETWFVNATGSCECGGTQEEGLSIQPKKGRAVVFWDMGWDGQPDPLAVHAGCKVVAGEKWSATKWLLTEPWQEAPEAPAETT